MCFGLVRNILRGILYFSSRINNSVINHTKRLCWIRFLTTSFQVSGVYLYIILKLKPVNFYQSIPVELTLFTKLKTIPSFYNNIIRLIHYAHCFMIKINPVICDRTFEFSTICWSKLLTLKNVYRYIIYKLIKIQGFSDRTWNKWAVEIKITWLNTKKTCISDETRL